MNQIPQIIEAVLFVAGEPVAIGEIAKALGLTEMELMPVVEQMERAYQGGERGVCLRRYGDHLQLATAPEYAQYVERLLQPVQRQTLSQTALETLAVVAYKQPVTKGEVEQVRGVKCDYSIQSLLHKQLIREVGRKEALGRPILYGTTDKFLAHFGISDIRELPPMPAGFAAPSDAPIADELSEEPLIP